MSTETRKNLIKPAGFPDFLAPDEEKALPAFGLAMGKAIQYEWFFRPEGGSGNTPCQYFDKREKYDLLRRYARGEQDNKTSKNLLNNGEETTYTNYDWRPIQIVPKFVKMVVNQMSERLFEIKADAVDKYSTDLKDSHRQYLEDLMATKPLMLQAKELLGVDISDNTLQEIPESQEEIDLHMAMKYKPAIEIATEEAVKFTFGMSDFDEIQNQVMEDVTVIGIGAVKHYTDPTKGILFKRIDPADLVYAYPKERNFESVNYYGEVERMTIMELKRITGDKFSNEQLTEIAGSSSQWNTYHNSSNQFNYNVQDKNLDGVLVDVMHFTFKSLNTITYKKKFHANGGYRMTKKASTFTKGSKNYEGYDVVKKHIDVWYEGSYILGTEHVFNYRLCENMVRPKGLLNSTIPNYVVYAPELYQNRSRSLVESVISLVDQMQQIWIKMQQAIAKSRPNGIYIDVNGLEEIALGDGNFLTPLELIKIYDETGNVLGSSVNSEGEYNYGKQPIQELRNGGVAGINDYIVAWNQCMNLFRDTIGIPVGADASTPHPDMAVGVQEQLALNSNTATRHILNAVLNITQRAAKGSVLRLRDIFKYSNLKEVYINAIGKINVELLDAIKDFHLHDLGILVSLKPDSQEKQQLEISINAALTKSEITLDDAIDLRSMSNLKQANQLLKLRRTKREKELREFELQKIKTNADAQKESAMLTAQSKMQELEVKAKTEIDVENTKSKNKLSELEAETRLKLMLMEKEFEFNMQLQGITIRGKESLLKQTQEGKVALQDRGNTQNSKMIEQRHYNAPSLNFESSEDTLSGNMDVGEIGVS